MTESIATGRSRSRGWATPILHGSRRSVAAEGQSLAAQIDQRVAHAGARPVARRSGRARSPCPRRPRRSPPRGRAARRVPSSGLDPKVTGPRRRDGGGELAESRDASRAAQVPGAHQGSDGGIERVVRARRPAQHLGEHGRELAADGDLLAGRGGVQPGERARAARSSADPRRGSPPPPRARRPRGRRRGSRRRSRRRDTCPWRRGGARRARAGGRPRRERRRTRSRTRTSAPPARAHSRRSPLRPSNMLSHAHAHAPALPSLELGLRFSLNRKHMFGRAASQGVLRTETRC